MNKTKKVLLAMSGGIDSSVSAMLLKEQGFDVTGIYFDLWKYADTGKNINKISIKNIKQVSKLIDMQYIVEDVKFRFKDKVVNYFIEQLSYGNTPNPCIICNPSIKMALLMEVALRIGAEKIATGHYARIKFESGSFQLLKAADLSKDQSYVLHQLNQDHLSKLIFPLGDLSKDQVRKYGYDFGFDFVNQSESQDLCFLSGLDYRKFLIDFSPSLVNPGEIVDIQGQILGKHNGLAFYTIGQRKGIGLSDSRPFFVFEKDFVNNRLIIAHMEELGKDTLLVDKVNWIDGQEPKASFEAFVKIRYKSNLLEGIIIPSNNGKVIVKFDKKLRDITPGQYAVFYQDDIVLGGGMISEKNP